MKKNMKKGLGFLALLLMVGLVASFTPGLISALEEPATAKDAVICPVTGEPCDEDCAGPGASADGTFQGRMRGGSVDGTFKGGMGGGMRGANPDGTFNGPAAGTEDGLRTRQRLQDGTAAGGQQRARARDGVNCLTETEPEA